MITFSWRHALLYMLLVTSWYGLLQCWLVSLIAPWGLAMAYAIVGHLVAITMVGQEAGKNSVPIIWIAVPWLAPGIVALIAARLLIPPPIRRPEDQK